MTVGLQNTRMALALVCLMATGFVAAQEKVPTKGIDPPFSLKWGEPPAGLISWAERYKLDVLVKAPGDRERINILVISPRTGTLPDHDSTSLEAHFIDGRLFEVSVHYTYPGQKPAHVRERFSVLRRMLTERFGPMTFNGRKRAKADGISTESEAFHVEPKPGHVVLLAFTEVRDVKRGDAAARYSLLFHNDDILTGP
jgi:hypothetical protein